jgi:two-component system response regulator RegX3
MSRIPVADDDQSILDALEYSLERAGFDVDTVTDGEAALAAARGTAYDLLILNVMMPRMFGTDVVRRLEGEATTPIVLISARDSREDRIEGLELGADDYVTKPFSPRELVSRVRAILRRQEQELHRVGLVRELPGMKLDYERGVVVRSGERIALTRSEVRLLGLLAERRGEVIGRRELMEHLWQSDWVGGERAGDIHVSNLRRKLGSDVIESVRGEGYRLRV